VEIFFIKAFDFKGFERFPMNKRVANSHRKGYPLSFIDQLCRQQIVHPTGVIVQKQG